MASLSGVQIVVMEPIKLIHTSQKEWTLEPGNYIATHIRLSDKGAEYALHKADDKWNAEIDRLANVGLRFDNEGGVEIR